MHAYQHMYMGRHADAHIHIHIKRARIDAEDNMHGIWQRFELWPIWS